MSVKVSSSGSGLQATGGFSIENLTVSGWFKRNGDTNNFSGLFVLVQGNGQQLVWLGTDSDGTTLGVYNGTNSQNSPNQWSTSWTHYTLVQTPTYIKFYVNGVLVTTLTDTSFSGSVPNLYVLSSNFDEWGDGEVQDIRYWARELSQPEIQAEYESIVPVSNDSLINHWPLVEHTNLTDVINANNFSALGSLTTGSTQPPGYGIFEEPSSNHCISLKKTDAIYSSAIPPLDGGMTFMGWFRFDIQPTSTFSIIMFAYDTVSATTPYVQLYSGDSGVNVRELWIDIGPNYTTTGISPAVGEWFHAAIVVGVSQGSAKVYVNGNFITSVGISAIGNLNRLSFGDIPGAGSSGFDGSVKAIKIFNDYLTDAEIVTEMNKVQPQNMIDALSSYTTNGITDLEDNISNNDLTLVGTPKTLLGPPLFSQRAINQNPKSLLLMY